MPGLKDFVFLDKKKKRWQKIIRGLRNFLLVADVVAIGTALIVFSVPRFGPTLRESFGRTPKEIIDELSTRQPEVIDLTGVGPVVNLQEKDGQLTLGRGKYRDEKVAVLTFDDGPDPIFTPQILEILAKEKVPAIFFLVGEQVFRYPNLAKEIVSQGHQIGNHTFFHIPEEVDLYPKQKDVGFELDFSQKIIMAQTGYKTKLFRVPYSGTEDTISLNNLIFSVMALDRNYQIFSSTTDSFDWGETEKEKIVSNAVKPEGNQVILLHDGGGDRTATVLALPEIIKDYREAGYQFKTADVFFENGQAVMVPTSFFEQVSSYLVIFLFWFKTNLLTFPNFLFRFCLGIIAVNFLVILVLATSHFTRNSNQQKSQFNPFVSVLVPAYNEEKTIEKTIESLLASDYPNFEVVVVDNNCRDGTTEKVRRFTSGKVRLIKEKIQGKYAALNQGIKNSWGEILVVVDADTQVLPNTLSQLVQPFGDTRVGAVAGNIKVGNIVNPLTAFQAVEYIVSLHLDRRAYEVVGALPVVPGALGAWRREAINTAGGYLNDTLTEDADLTVRIQRQGWRVVFAPEAVAYTEAPQNLRAFLRQRVRWTYGMLQVLFKNRKIYFKREHGTLGMILLPYLSLVQLPFMLLAPLVDFLALVFFIFVSPEDILRYFLIFLLFNFCLTLLAFIFAKETRIWLLALVPAQRLFYQMIWYCVLYRSFLTALKGSFVPWKKLVHLGSVNLEEPRRPAAWVPEILEQ
jgi:cellulose synthase/poly-beta-1,6-N-acetylglucosamine synthase-like glycosyltransferase/peptidoglycan/xylan/chitin deacetylase (PgdA/CDA1 family)